MRSDKKHYLSLYYGVDESLPDKEFLKQIQDINRLLEECLEEMKRTMLHGTAGQRENEYQPKENS